MKFSKTKNLKMKLQIITKLKKKKKKRNLLWHKGSHTQHMTPVILQYDRSHRELSEPAGKSPSHNKVEIVRKP